METDRPLKTVMLDLGGVLIDVDYTAAARAFAGLGFTDFAGLYSKARQDHLFDGFETGAISPAQFRDRIRGLYGKPIADADIDACWNAMLGSIPPERIELVRRLKERYQLLLFSNTNAIHVPAFEAIVARENGIPNFKGLFDGAWYSCAIGLRKPDAEAFRYVLREARAEAASTLFIDDSIQHVEGARKAGLQAEHLDLGKEDVIGLAGRLGLLAGA